MQIRCAQALQTIFLLCAIVLHSGCATEKDIHRPIRTSYGVSDPVFRQSMSQLLGAPLIEGNKITTLINGDEIFPAMLEAIRNARETITCEMYIWGDGEVSEEFVIAMEERAIAGVRVHIVADAMGSYKLPRKSINRLKKAGVKFVKYNHPHWWRLFHVLNHRTHRKILVVDGRIAFTGGICIHDDWVGNAEAPPFWRDNHYRIEGPVAGQVQAVFVDNWIQAYNQVLHGPKYFPVLTNAGPMIAQSFKAGPTDGAELARMNFLMSIAAAKKHIRIAHAYFMPDELLIGELIEARKRGVKIEVIVPGEIDAGIVKAASRPRWARLMEAGVEMYEYQPSLYHCKLMIIDDAWVTIGSANFDERSLKINDELGLNVLDKNFAAEQIEIFEKDKKECKPVTLKAMRGRGTVTKFLDHFLALFSRLY